MTEFPGKEEISVKQWCLNYGRHIAITIVFIGILIVFGFLYWHLFFEKTEQASQLYTEVQILTSLHKWGEVNRLTHQLVENYSRTPYAAMASLLSAKHAVAQNNYSAALKQLLWVIDNAAPPLQQIARLRAARIYLAQNQTDKALDLLQTVNNSTFVPLIENIKGDIYVKMGNKLVAEKSYVAADKGMRAMGVDDLYLQLKISSL